jgi:uncharacterized protein (DUF1501 family)
MTMTNLVLSRRAFLIGCSAAASPLLTPVSFAQAKGENRLVVILLRGAMDGLDVVRPVGDPAYASLRPTLSREQGVPLDDFFALHPAAADLLPLWQAGQLGFVQAVATPYRARSHFVAQDALENGAGGADGAISAARDGWLNRAVGLIPKAAAQTAVSVGRERLMILDGDVPTAHWFPAEEIGLSSQGIALLTALHEADPLLAATFAEAQDLTKATATERIPLDSKATSQLGTYVAGRLREDARIASFSLGGWDTHQTQAKTMAKQMPMLAGTLLSIKAGLGPAWGTTLVLAMTEFGRTARENGSAGTDHGTGGLMIAAGGALRGGRVFGRWPGLGDGQLLVERDLMPTGDVRAYAGWALRNLFGIEAQALERVVFPGLDLGDDPGMLL